MRSRWVGAVLAVTAVTGAGVTYSAKSHGDSAPATSAHDAATATAKVQKGDMVVSDTADGTLGYGNKAEVAGKVAGTVTRLPGKGAVVHRGRRLYAVDGQPIFLLYGKVPAYRAMTVGTEGADVLQLERNLRDMGYGENLQVDQTYTGYTASAVRAWQDDERQSKTGEIGLGAVIFRPGPVRVAEHRTTAGAEIGRGHPVITVTALDTFVNVDLPVEQRPLATKSATVKITLPNGRTVPGRVTSVGNVAETSGGGEGEEEKTTVKVKISLTRPGSAGSLDEAPVDVTFESERREDVLSVPVNALIALPKGGYGVVVVNDDRSRKVKVDLGVFANGRVEVSSTELRAGMNVEVPAP